MGSGLILLVIVGAWLAVLVPMALRSQDSNSSLGTVDKFHDAMRVLSRRDGVASVEEPAAARAPARALTRTPARTPARPPTRPAEPEQTSRRSLSLRTAAQRRRVLVGLLAGVLVTLVGTVVGPLWLLAPHGVAVLLLVGYLGWLRHQTILRAEREWRTALGERRPAPVERRVSLAAQAAANVAVRPIRVAGVPERIPARAVVGTTLLPELVRPEPVPEVAEVPATRGAQGAEWSPVPVPLPVYLSAPRRTPSASRSDGVAAAERELGIDDRGPELDQILDRKRAVND